MYYINICEINNLSKRQLQDKIKSHEYDRLSEKKYKELTEAEKRFYQRDLTRKGNYSLNIVAKNTRGKEL